MFHGLMLMAGQAADAVQYGLTAGGTTEVKPFLVTSGLIFIILDWLKTKKWYRDFVHTFPAADKWAHRSTAGIISFLTGLGIHITYQGSLLSGGIVTAQYPPLVQMLSSITHVGSDASSIYIMQQVIYMIAHRDVNTMTGHVELQPVDVTGLPPASKK